MIFQTKKKKQVEFLFQYNFSEVRGMGRVNSVILPVWLVNKSVYVWQCLRFGRFFLLCDKIKQPYVQKNLFLAGEKYEIWHGGI